MVHLLMIGAVAAVVLRDAQHEPPLAGLVEDRGGATLWTLVPIALIVLAAWARAARAARRLDRLGDAREIRASDRWCAAARFGATAWFVLGVLGLGWLDDVRTVTGDLVAIDELLALLPLCAAMMMTWWAWHPVERRVREAMLFRAIERGEGVHPLPSRWRSVWLATRHQLLFVLVPLGLILSWSEGVAVAIELSERAPGGFWGRVIPAWARTPGWATGLQLGGVVVVMALSPLVLRFVWDTTRLGDGPLRAHLVSMCKRHRVRVAELLVWRTGGTMINGAVLGLVYPARYVLLTDALLDALPARQVEAVMAHEIAHVRRRHMPWLALGVLGTLIGTGSLLSLLAWWAGVLGASWAGVTIGGVSIGMGWVVFGWASRAFERQADAFAVQHLTRFAQPPAGPTELAENAEGQSSPSTWVTPEAAGAMAGALGRVAALNHVPPERFTWRHGSIADRQRRLLAAVGRRLDDMPPDRVARGVKLAILGIAACAGVLLMLEMALTGGFSAGASGGG